MKTEKLVVGRLFFLLGCSFFSGATVDGRNPAPLGMYKNLVENGIYDI